MQNFRNLARAAVPGSGEVRGGRIRRPSPPPPRDSLICQCQVFSAALTAFKANLQSRVSGLADDYMLKCMFDCLVNVGLVRAGLSG